MITEASNAFTKYVHKWPNPVSLYLAHPLSLLFLIVSKLHIKVQDLAKASPLSLNILSPRKVVAMLDTNLSPAAIALYGLPELGNPSFEIRSLSTVGSGLRYVVGRRCLLRNLRQVLGSGDFAFMNVNGWLESGGIIARSLNGVLTDREGLLLIIDCLLKSCSVLLKTLDLVLTSGEIAV
ncbi:hypothetical protein Slin15195_G130050 [Septoria linicola]|uniref:Uncharacterized protein n=1 Tax=Septoria linicola TaxID=215465 RepID=A0A9Q9EQD0_9PEZI|nr:hypothetical protein Slin14017_G121940 [Septoria linicola]USW59686.1 hypothetical protein Slin15195_G130050 [Septoria linicola]